MICLLYLKYTNFVILSNRRWILSCREFTSYIMKIANGKEFVIIKRLSGVILDSSLLIMLFFIAFNVLLC